MKNLILSLGVILVSATLKLSAYECQPCCRNSLEGFYLNGNFGFSNLNSAYFDSDGVIVNTTTYEGKDTRWAAGLGLGYNWIQSNYFAGFIADWGFPAAKIHLRYLTQSVDRSLKTTVNWFSTFRMRMGVHLCEKFFYITGGAVVGDIRFKVISGTLFPPVPFSQTFHKKHWGWTLGFGTEFAVCYNWSVNAELLYLHFNPNKVLVNAVRAVTLNRHSIVQNDAIWVGRIGVNYHFSLKSFFGI